MKEPTIQFLVDPKSGEPKPPAKELAPTESSEKPMAVTTVAATMGDIIFIQYFAKSPSRPSTIPPTITAPISTPMPWLTPMEMARERKVKLIPITIGSLEPTLQIG